MLSKFQLIVMIIIGGCLLSFLHGRYEWQRIELTPDSTGYHFLAVNMMQGKGYYGGPVGSIDDYDDQTIERFSVNKTMKADRPSMFRTPGYPLFLLLIYRIHGINPDVVVRYQIVLAGLIGVLMVLTGYLMWGKSGALAGLIAVFVLGMNRDMGYPVSQLLTECLATFFLTAAAAGAVWAKRGNWKRELLVSLLLVLAIMTRPALVFVGLVYGGILILQSMPTSWKRIFVFAGPCAIILLAWCIFASSQANRLILLAPNGLQSLLAGLDPVGTAEEAGLEPPQLNEMSLNSFWRTFPGVSYSRPEFVWKLLSRIPGRWKEVFAIMVIKLKVGTHWLPRSLWACMLLGFALAGSISLRTGGHEFGKDSLRICMSPRGLIRSRKWIERLFLAAAVLLGIIVLGFSTTLVMAFFWILPIVAPLFRIEIASKETLEKGKWFVWPHWILSWYGGYLLMTLMTIGLRRYMRPYLPIFYLCATMAIPLLGMVLLGLKKGSLELRRNVFFNHVRDEVKS